MRDPNDTSDNRASSAFRGRFSPALERLPGAALLLGWAALILALFYLHLPESLRPRVELFKTAGLGLLSLYGFWFLGWRIRKRLLPVETRLSPLEASLLEIALGMGGIIAALFGLGVAGWYSVESAWAVLLLPLVGLHVPFWTDLRRRARVLGAVERSPFFISVSLLVGLIALVASLTPATSQDALVYHLAVPARYIAEGRIHFVEGNFFSAFPQNVEMLFTLGLLLDGESLAKSYHWLLGVLAVLSASALAARLAPGFRGKAGALAAALLGTIPTVVLIAGWAYVDLGVVFFSTLSTVIFLEWFDSGATEGADRKESLVMLGLAAAAAGLAAGCKYTGGAQGLFVALLALVIGRLRRRPVRDVLVDTALVCLVVSAFVAPWYIRNIVTTGNPVFPFFYSVLGGHGWDAQRASVLALSLSEWGAERSGWRLLTLPWDVSLSGRFFSQDSFDGVVGGAFLIGAPLALWGLRRSGRIRLAFAMFVLHALFWVAMTHQIRFLLPALAVASAIIAASVVSLPGDRVRRAAAVALGVCVLCNVSLPVRHFAAHNPLPVVLGLEGRNAFLHREVPGGDYNVFRYIAEQLPPESHILFGSCGNPGYLCKRPYRSDALFENRTLARYLRESEDAEALRDRLLADGFTHIVYRFDCVFDPSGRRSEIPFADQEVLARFLNEHAQIEWEEGGTFLHSITRPCDPRGARTDGER